MDVPIERVFAGPAAAPRVRSNERRNKRPFALPGQEPEPRPEEESSAERRERPRPDVARDPEEAGSRLDVIA